MSIATPGCACGVGEGQKHRDGCDGVVRQTYKRTGLRVKLHEPPYHLDLDSFEVAAERVSSNAHELRLSAMRLKHACEERERANAAHEVAMRDFNAARIAYERSRSDMSFVEAGNVLGELKAVSLPEACKKHGDHGCLYCHFFVAPEPVKMPTPGDGS